MHPPNRPLLAARHGSGDVRACVCGARSRCCSGSDGARSCRRLCACLTVAASRLARSQRVLELQLQLLGHSFDADLAVHALDAAVFEHTQRNGGLTATLADSDATHQLRKLLSRPLHAYTAERRRRRAEQQPYAPAAGAPAAPPEASVGRGRKACRGCGEVWPSAKRECDSCGATMYAPPPRAEPQLERAAPSAAATEMPRRRAPGSDYLDRASVRAFLASLRSNTNDGEAGGRVLWLKHHVSADAGPAVIDAVLDALAENTLVQVLYIHNFENGMYDAQLDKLLKARRADARRTPPPS